MRFTTNLQQEMEKESMSSSIARRPLSTDYSPDYEGYISLVPEADIVSVLREQNRQVTEFIKAIPQASAGFRYAPEKWSIREVLGHVADSERVFSYRATCLARGEQSALPGFEEKEYVRTANFDKWSLSELSAEFDNLRKANLLLLEHLDEEAWQRSGTVNQNHITVPGLVWIMAGHVRHHVNVLNERYLPKIAGGTT